MLFSDTTHQTSNKHTHKARVSWHFTATQTWRRKQVPSVSGMEMTIVNSNFSDCRAVQDRGVVRIYNCANVSMEGSIIQRSSSRGSGGGVAASRLSRGSCLYRRATSRTSVRATRRSRSVAAASTSESGTRGRYIVGSVSLRASACACARATFTRHVYALLLSGVHHSAGGRGCVGLRFASARALYLSLSLEGPWATAWPIMMDPGVPLQLQKCHRLGLQQSRPRALGCRHGAGGLSIRHVAVERHARFVRSLRGWKVSGRCT
jgi:hypothetical protein